MNEQNKFTKELRQMEKEFFQKYDLIYKNQEGRHKGTFAKEPKRLSKSKLKRIWEEFVKSHKYSYLDANPTITLTDILKIGIDKFVITNGWSEKSHVGAWINNRVRVGICAHCRDQFIPLMFQVNYGLCNSCVQHYSDSAIQKYIEKVATTDQRYENSLDDVLMDFFIMFYHDEIFRKLFLKGDEFAKGMEAMVIERADWLEDEITKRAKGRGAIIDA